MAKKRRNKPSAPNRAPKPAVDAPPARTLIEFTERGFDALGDRRSRVSDLAGKPDRQGRAFAEAVKRLKADYKRVLKRR